jgi:hypothetical protein
MRVSGRVAVIEDPPEFEGLFAFIIYVDDKEMAQHGPYETEDIAFARMRDAINFFCNYCQTYEPSMNQYEREMLH